MTPKMERRKFNVIDHERTLTFSGVLLGHASSEGNGKQRWTEMSVYRTDAGKYIVAGVGKTTIKKGDKFYDDRSESYVIAQETEKPRAWAHVCDSAEGALQSMYMYDQDQVRYMTNVTRTALEQAMSNDTELRKAFSVEQIA